MTEMEKRMDKIGKLIVLDGADGSGKATQTQLLLERLKAEGRTAEKLDFPRYKDNILGKLIGECIAGEHGDFLHMDPYVASVLYAGDRFESKNVIQQWLSKGTTVVLDRYASANQIHQGGKIDDTEKRRAFLAWLDKLEYEMFGIPRADVTIYLRVPTDISIRLLQEKRTQEKKSDYLKVGKKDTVEIDRAYMEQALLSAQYLMETQPHWQMVDCAQDGALRSREEIHDDIWNIVTKAIAR